jgi:hypothetical protein
MPEAYVRLEPTLIPMLRPLCPTCWGRMMLSCIEPDCDGPDLRIFECSKCGHAYKAPAEDPIKLVRSRQNGSRTQHSQVSNVFPGRGIAISSSDAAPQGIVQIGGVVPPRHEAG